MAVSDRDVSVPTGEYGPLPVPARIVSQWCARWLSTAQQQRLLPE